MRVGRLIQGKGQTETDLLAEERKRSDAPFRSRRRKGKNSAKKSGHGRYARERRKGVASYQSRGGGKVCTN